MDRPRTLGSKSGQTFLMDSLLICLFVGLGMADCEGCVEYCCDGAPPFCCSYYTYVGEVLSGTAISGMVFGVVFLMGAVAAMFLCVCVCVRNMRGVGMQDLRTSHLSTISQGHPGLLPPYCYDPEMDPYNSRPPAYTPTPPIIANHSPPPPYPGNPCK
ncbi:cysteine and tyrosine-rich protein 1-like isoform X2 [Anguilla anguilla]|uniref:cysteine and tyrosine-rich protein 1-like isoform X2 n=1 Tax=Anguilla anguilla TaxID=7936 RepID=UPI0015AEEB81|nr:cysteine and tyrosine-rich protein 1-like isoform X2 [Anguilla anguilla]